MDDRDGHYHNLPELPLDSKLYAMRGFAFLKAVAPRVWSCTTIFECLMECVVKLALTLKEHIGTLSLT